MAAQATLHCLLGCIIGELAGLEIGRLMGFDTHVTIALAAVLSFVSGYTVSTIPLVEEGWSSLHSVIEEKRFWEVIDQLKKAGAEGILIIPIEKMIL
jgi:ATP phosphoribosyltransferase-like protein